VKSLGEEPKTRSSEGLRILSLRASQDTNLPFKHMRTPCIPCSKAWGSSSLIYWNLDGIFESSQGPLREVRGHDCAGCFPRGKRTAHEHMPGPIGIGKFARRGYLRGCSLDSAPRPWFGMAPPKVRKTLRRTTADKMSKVPIRKRPKVSGRLDSELRIVSTPYWKQMAHQTGPLCIAMKINDLTHCCACVSARYGKRSGKLLPYFSEDRDAFRLSQNPGVLMPTGSSRTAATHCGVS
jgi:hypothetical protein